ncbi:MAG: hypothetical protein ACXW3P_02660, partial [Rhodospirillales bacterium]
WRLDGERMDLTWSERDGPAVAAAPTARGFGSLLTRSSVEGQLGGSIVYDWARSGLRFMARIPLRNILP